MENKTHNLFVKFDEAKALKELGFDDFCFGYYGTTDKSFYGCRMFNSLAKNSIDTDVISAPTYQQAFNFFREKYKLMGYVDGLTVGNSYKGIICIKGEEALEFLKHAITTPYLETHEEAEALCLKYLITFVKAKNNG